MEREDDLLIAVTPKIAPDTMIEVCRSFSYKLNLANYGGAPYESEDFFSSKKMQVPYQYAAGISELLYQECVQEVGAAVRAVKAKLAMSAARKSVDRAKAKPAAPFVRRTGTTSRALSDAAQDSLDRDEAYLLSDDIEDGYEGGF